MHLLILLSQSRASSVSELSIVGKPVISFSNVAEDHQTKNAKAIVDKKGTFIERI
jgi:UDP-N-acetylglucosamine--N-acetylmuramyl-(pentapeptide) pyrophosphoryl-undecaprenol N-acetylglucosamine transferase